MNIKITKQPNTSYCVIAKAKFDNDVETVFTRITEGMKKVIEDRCVGAFDVSVSALITFAIDELENTKSSIVIFKDNVGEVDWCYEVSYEQPKRPVKVACKASRKNTKPIAIRMPKLLKLKLKSTTEKGFTIAALGLIKYALDLIKERDIQLTVLK